MDVFRFLLQVRLREKNKKILDPGVEEVKRHPQQKDQAQ